MRRVAAVVTRHPVRVVLVWLAVAAAVIGLTAPGGAIERADVMESEQAEFLPDSYESVRAAQLEQAGFPTPDGATATLVIRRADRKPLTRANVARAVRLSRRVATTEGVRAAVVDTSGLSPNGKVLLGSVLFERTVFDEKIAADVDAVRDRTEALFDGRGLVAGYAGEAPAHVDAAEREGLTSTLTMLVILVLLVVLFRSLVVGLFDVLLIGIVGAAAAAMIVIGAELFGFAISSTVTGLLTIVTLGVGTDYVVFLLHRYRERLRTGEEPRQAMQHAITRIGPAIAFSALTVVVSLSALTLSSLSSLRVLGPALGFGVLATLVAALTLVPAVAVLLRRALFWPSRQRAAHALARTPGRTERFVAGRPVGALLASALVLIALAVPALGFQADYDIDANIPGSASAKAFADLEAGFPEGALEPTTVMLRRDDGGRLTAAAIKPVADAMRDTAGVGQVRPVALADDGRTARVEALLDVAPYSAKALDTIEDRLRPAVAAAAPAGVTAEVGGSTSVFADVRDAIGSDQTLIFPVAALLIGAILVLLLRSVAVPLFVMAGVALGFLAALGASVVAFQGIGGESGLNFQLPLIVYLFVASMVSDYAILILARIREELAAGRTPRGAAAIALQTAGPSVTAAGIVLAASFAVLVISPSLSDIGFAVAAGILLSAVVTARLFVPALTVLAGRSGWWPSRHATPPPPAEVVALPDRDEVIAG